MKETLESIGVSIGVHRSVIILLSWGRIIDSLVRFYWANCQGIAFTKTTSLNKEMFCKINLPLIDLVNYHYIQNTIICHAALLALSHSLYHNRSGYSCSVPVRWNTWWCLSLSKKKNLQLCHFRHFPYVIFAPSFSTADCENPISYGEGKRKRKKAKRRGFGRVNSETQNINFGEMRNTRKRYKMSVGISLLKGMMDVVAREGSGGEKSSRITEKERRRK